MRPTLLLLAPLCLGAQTVHEIKATSTTVAYGYYWSDAKPALRVKSGDVVDVETMLTNSPAGLERIGVRSDEVPQALRDIVSQDTGSLRGPGGHILTGPIYIEGADSGDVLEVRIQSITLPVDYAYNGCSGFVRDLCGPPGTRVSTLIHLDRENMTAEVAPGITVPLRPFFGSMGVAPAPALGRVSSNPPSRHAGNLDNKELVAGTTLYIPVFVKGALLEVGDGHAAQGDGEVDQTAIETNLRGRLQLVVRKDMKLEWPRGETPTHWIAIGTDTSLVVATKTAIREMVKLLQEKKGITEVQSYQAASMAADLHITQLVDGNVGVHMMIAKQFLNELSNSGNGASRLQRIDELLTPVKLMLSDVERVADNLSGQPQTDSAVMRYHQSLDLLVPVVARLFDSTAAHSIEQSDLSTATKAFFAERGIFAYVAEGSRYYDVSNSWFLDHVGKRGTPALRMAFEISANEEAQATAADGSIEISWDELGARYAKADSFMTINRRSIARPLVDHAYESYRYLYLGGAPNTPAFDRGSQRLLPEVRRSYEAYVAAHLSLPSAQLVRRYLALLAANGFRRTDAVTAFLKANRGF